MEKKTFHVPKISCGHCVMAIQNELREMQGVAAVEGNPTAKTIEVRWESPPPKPRFATAWWISTIRPREPAFPMESRRVATEAAVSVPGIGLLVEAALDERCLSNWDPVWGRAAWWRCS